MNDIVINKIQNIQRSIGRAREEYNADRHGFATNYTRQDAAMLNVLRACETAIDLANHIIRAGHLGMPVSAVDSFTLLQSAGIIDASQADRLAKMAGFRNLVVHRYKDIDIKIVESVIASDLDQLIAFADTIRQYVSESE